MRIQGENREKVYRSFEEVFFDITDTEWSWKSGEKTKVIKMFNRVAEAMEIRDEDRFDEVVVYFEEYLEAQTVEWAQWRKRSRDNYIGFVNNKENIELFVKTSMLEDNRKNQDVGTESKDNWEW